MFFTQENLWQGTKLSIPNIIIIYIENFDLTFRAIIKVKFYNPYRFTLKQEKLYFDREKLFISHFV